MSYIARCPRCRVRIRIAKHLLGRRVRCPNKGQPAHAFRVVLRKESQNLPAAVSSKPAVPPTIRKSPTHASRLSPTPPARPVDPEAQRRKNVGMTLCLAGLAFFLAPVQSWLALMAGAAGLLLGLRVVWQDLLADRAIKFSGSTAALSLLALIACFWPSLLYPSTNHQRPALPRVEVLSRQAGAQSRRARENEWVSATDFDYKLGDLVIRVLHAKILQRSGRNLLEVQLSFTNRGTRPAAYYGWGGLTRPTPLHTPRLLDENDQPYPLHFQPKPGLPPQAINLRIEVGKEMRETLVFSEVSTHTDALRLELPAAAFGLPGQLRWQIPREWTR